MAVMSQGCLRCLRVTNQLLCTRRRYWDLYKKVLNKALRLNGFAEYQNLCINPNDTLEVEGFNPRSMAPYFMINIFKKALQKGNKSLQKQIIMINFLQVKKILKIGPVAQG